MPKHKTLIAGCVAAGLLAMPAAASAHATMNPFTPGAPSLTGARQNYLLRVPTENPKVGTYKVVMLVPEAIQGSISFINLPGWRVDLKRVRTGATDDEGNPVMKVVKVTWTARNRDVEIDPNFYAEFPVRFQNPATAGRLCFAISQWYRKDNRRRAGGEIVRWWGGPQTEKPASCLNVTES